MKEKCDCGKEAVWLYMPGYGDGGNPFSCNDCITTKDYLGCSCNYHYAKPSDDMPADEPEGVEGVDWRWVVFEGDNHTRKITKEEGIWCYLDDQGRPYPCVEYDYSADGYEDEIDTHNEDEFDR